MTLRAINRRLIDPSAERSGCTPSDFLEACPKSLERDPRGVSPPPVIVDGIDSVCHLLLIHCLSTSHSARCPFILIDGRDEETRPTSSRKAFENPD
jgi:hypothetical protein